MSDAFTFEVDGRTVKGQPGQSILQASEASGIYIPRLCARKELTPHGSCRVCTVLVNGHAQAACTTPAAPGLVVTNDTERLLRLRRDLIDMLFVEGNHFCMFCEKSGQCELQALAYRFGITAPRFPFQNPRRDVDTSHPDVLIDHNRCVLCARCVRASGELDGKHVFGFVGRAGWKRLAVSASDGLAGTELEASDKALDVCPVGAILRKRVGFAVPVGERRFDGSPIGVPVEVDDSPDAVGDSE